MFSALRAAYSSYWCSREALRSSGWGLFACCPSRLPHASNCPAARAFDVLYVADPYRDWYGGGTDDVQDDGERDPDNAPPPLSYYRTRLESYTRQYRRVLMLGDSMGATATLLCADLATAALAFCPQVRWFGGAEDLWGASVHFVVHIREAPSAKHRTVRDTKRTCTMPAVPMLGVFNARTLNTL